MFEFDNLKGQVYGIWKVITFAYMKYNGTNHKRGMSYYFCECQKCGKRKVIARSQLTHGKSTTHRNCKARIT